MKPLSFLLLLTCLSNVGFAQSFRIDSLPKQGILLDKGWKFHAGDNPDFAKADYDDSAWESIDPTKDILDLPQLDKQTGQISWFRLSVKFTKTVSRQLMFRFIQSGASEVFINGKRIWRFGVISAQPNQIKAYSPKALLPYYRQQDSTVVIAVRYGLQPGLRYVKSVQWENLTLSVNISEATSTMEHYDTFNLTRIQHSEIFRFGAFFILFFLFLSFYLFYPTQKTYLYLCLYTLLKLVDSPLQIYLIWNAPVQLIFYVRNVQEAASLLSNFLLLTALYSLLYQKKGFYYWFLFGLIFVGIFAFLYSYSWASILTTGIIPNITNLEIIRISIKAIGRKQRGAWIIGCGCIVYAISWGIFVIGIPTNWIYIPLANSIYTTGDLVYNLAFLSIPVAVSIYIGLDIAFTNRSLQQKIIEVEKLSVEKQQILTTQNETLETQVAERTAELIASQNQLIQKEKLASLGELTAGIAHEIQNPLNFVNNFSEVSAELVTELEEEQQKPERDPALEAELLGDLKQNLQKITHHGGRASAIVKGMLEHSRTSTGQREPTDLNALADEYLRLAYHGLRAKDKTFNAELKTDFDANLPVANVIAQDMGRVLLNLINNAFYAVGKKASTQPEGYQPTVTVSTKQLADGIEIRVIDNGIGMPENVREKIFQPFFTTKPTGEGTGLGLSLAYDIVTKGHGGTLEVESEEGKGTTFLVTLPV